MQDEKIDCPECHAGFDPATFKAVHHVWCLTGRKIEALKQVAKAERDAQQKEEGR